MLKIFSIIFLSILFFFGLSQYASATISIVGERQGYVESHMPNVIIQLYCTQDSTLFFHMREACNGGGTCYNASGYADPDVTDSLGRASTTRISWGTEFNGYQYGIYTVSVVAGVVTIDVGILYRDDTSFLSYNAFCLDDINTNRYYYSSGDAGGDKWGTWSYTTSVSVATSSLGYNNSGLFVDFYGSSQTVGNFTPLSGQDVISNPATSSALYGFYSIGATALNSMGSGSYTTGLNSSVSSNVAGYHYSFWYPQMTPYVPPEEPATSTPVIGWDGYQWRDPIYCELTDVSCQVAMRNTGLDMSSNDWVGFYTSSVCHGNEYSSSTQLNLWQTNCWSEPVACTGLAIPSSTVTSISNYCLARWRDGEVIATTSLSAFYSQWYIEPGDIATSSYINNSLTQPLQGALQSLVDVISNTFPITVFGGFVTSWQQSENAPLASSTFESFAILDTNGDWTVDIPFFGENKFRIFSYLSDEPLKSAMNTLRSIFDVLLPGFLILFSVLNLANIIKHLHW